MSVHRSTSTLVKASVRTESLARYRYKAWLDFTIRHDRIQGNRLRRVATCVSPQATQNEGYLLYDTLCILGYVELLDLDSDGGAGARCKRTCPMVRIRIRSEDVQEPRIHVTARTVLVVQD